MVIMTAKVSKRKMLLVLLLLVLAAAVLITCLKRADTPDTSQDTAEEIAAQEEALKPVPTPTLENRVEVLESTTDDMILLMADLIGGE